MDDHDKQIAHFHLMNGELGIAMRAKLGRGTGRFALVGVNNAVRMNAAASMFA
jgi:hypothetical protein